MCWLQQKNSLPTFIIQHPLRLWRPNSVTIQPTIIIGITEMNNDLKSLVNISVIRNSRKKSVKTFTLLDLVTWPILIIFQLAIKRKLDAILHTYNVHFSWLRKKQGSDTLWWQLKILLIVKLLLKTLSLKFILFLCGCTSSLWPWYFWCFFEILCKLKCQFCFFISGDCGSNQY